MAEREKQEAFVVNDRRKFRSDGEPITPTTIRHEEQQTATAVAEPVPQPELEPPVPLQTEPDLSENEMSADPSEPKGPSDEDIAASQHAYQATAERMDDIVRANNPGAPQDGPVTFDRVIQSLYITAIVQLGLNTPAGQQMRVDLLAARHSIDMLGVLAEKVKGNTTPDEDKLLQTALFELRMSFLEVTQMLAQNAQAKAAPAAGIGPAGKLKI